MTCLPSFIQKRSYQLYSEKIILTLQCNFVLNIILLGEFWNSFDVSQEKKNMIAKDIYKQEKPVMQAIDDTSKLIN